MAEQQPNERKEGKNKREPHVKVDPTANPIIYYSPDGKPVPGRGKGKPTPFEDGDFEQIKKVRTGSNV